MNPLIDIDKVKKIVDVLIKGKVIDAILVAMGHGFGEITFKINIHNGVIKKISITDTKTVMIE